jgi:A/G-specific adenine glycosylase
MKLSTHQIKRFTKTLYDYFHANGRNDLPWRKNITPYKVLVSEIMLQQTQVHRSIDKYKEFIRAFPNFKTLAHASQADVLKVWQGLGYNRRALFLKKCAEEVTKTYHGRLPKEKERLMPLPGIGAYTASAIRAFAFNIADPLIETNVRTVIIHHFFNDKEGISDSDILEVLEQVLDTKNPAKFYSSIMDYGTYLKSIMENPSRKSTKYVKQKPLKGSNREARGIILKLLISNTLSELELITDSGINDGRIEKNLSQLVKEGFIKKHKTRYYLQR